MKIMRYGKGKRKPMWGRKRTVSAMLSFCIAFTSLACCLQADPVMAGEPQENAFVVTGFSELPDEVTRQRVPVGTPEDEIKLPDRLNATAYREGDDSKQTDGGLGAVEVGDINPGVSGTTQTPTQEEEGAEKPPETMPEGTPGITPEETPGTTPEETPGTTPGTAPEETPGTTPEETPGTAPEETPGTAPEETPGTAPEETPGTTPEETPGTAPEETPGTAPEEIPGESSERSGAGSDQTASLKAAENACLTISKRQIPCVAVPQETGAPLPESAQTDITEKESIAGEIHASDIVIRDVVWDSSPLYDGDTPGIYLFTPSLPDNYCVEDEDCLPQIEVEVLEEQRTVEWVTAGIDALPSADSIYENMPGDADPGFDTWLAGIKQTLAEIRAVKEAYDALPDEDKELIDEERLNKLMDLSVLAERLSEMEVQNTERNGKWTEFAAGEFAGGDGTADDPFKDRERRPVSVYGDFGGCFFQPIFIR